MGLHDVSVDFLQELVTCPTPAGEYRLYGHQVSGCASVLKMGCKLDGAPVAQWYDVPQGAGVPDVPTDLIHTWTPTAGQSVEIWFDNLHTGTVECYWRLEYHSNDTLVVLGTDWASRESGLRTDRGWEHFCEFSLQMPIGNGNDVRVGFEVPSEEHWLIDWAKWLWEAEASGAITWASGTVQRILRQGQDYHEEIPADPALEHGWQPFGTQVEQVLLTTASTPEAHELWAADLKTARLWGGSRLEFLWETCDQGAREDDSILTLQVLLQRIAHAKRGIWTTEGAERAFTAMQELSRRVD